MSFKDIKVVQVTHAVKEVIKGKRKHSWKRKSATLEVDELKVEVELEVVHAVKEVIMGKKKRC